MRDFVAKVHGNAKDVLTAVKEAITEGAANPADIAQKAVDYIKAKLSCENILSKTVSVILNFLLFKPPFIKDCPLIEAESSVSSFK